MNPKQKIKFNILDMLIILLIAAALITFIFRNSISEWLSGDDGEEITYTFIIRNTHESIYRLLETDQVLTESQSGKNAGRISAITAKNTVKTEQVRDEDGGYRDIQITVADRYDVTVSAVGDGYHSENGTYLKGNILIAAGKEYTLHTIYGSYDVLIISMN